MTYTAPHLVPPGRAGRGVSPGAIARPAAGTPGRTDRSAIGPAR
ncbi:hypothetical protein [Streptomyces phaeofaciens]